MLTYSRTIPVEKYSDTLALEVETAIRSHLSACASLTDDAYEFSGEVMITRLRTLDGLMKLTGTLDRSKQAPYTVPGYNAIREEAHYTYRRWVPRS